MDKGADKVRENRLRRMAGRQGFVLVKSRRRDPRAVDYGGYWLVDPRANALVAGEQFGLDLDEVERELLATPKGKGQPREVLSTPWLLSG